MATFARPNPATAVPAIRLSEVSVGRKIPVFHANKRIKELDGLRGIAILLVLLCHSTFELHPSSPLLSRLLSIGRLSWSGVDLFFVLSGFLIGGILLDARKSTRYFKTFYLRRAFRILPPYLGVLFLFLFRFVRPSAGAMGAFSQNQIPVFAYFTFTQNLWMARLGTFGAGTLAATWSLAIEEQFYLTVPPLIRKLTRRKLTIFLLSMLATVPIIRTVLYFGARTGNFSDYVLMPCRADALSAGVLIALLTRNYRWWKVAVAHRTLLNHAALLLFAVLATLTPWATEFSGAMVTIGYSCLALFYGALLLIVLTGANRTLTLVLRNRTLMKLGTLAYFTYLFHLSLMEASRRVLAHAIGNSSELTCWMGGLIGIGVTLFCAAISWKYFEGPLLSRAHRYKY